MTVYRITGGGDEEPAAVVTTPDEPYRGIAEDDTHQQARTATLEALDSITRRPNETILAAALRLASACRASATGTDRPHASDKLLLWWYVSESRLKGLMRRLTVMVMPAGNEQADRESTATSRIQRVAEELEPYHVVPQDPTGLTMRARARSLSRFSPP